MSSVTAPDCFLARQIEGIRELDAPKRVTIPESQ